MVEEKNLESKFISEDGYDLCTRCNGKTIYKTETQIHNRFGYIEGSGQLCGKCYEKVYTKRQKNKLNALYD